MEEQAESMEQEMQSGEKEQHEEDIKVNRQLLEKFGCTVFLIRVVDQRNVTNQLSDTTLCIVGAGSIQVKRQF